MDKAKLLELGRRKPEGFPIDALGGEMVYFRRLSAAEGENYFESVSKKGEKGETEIITRGMRAKLIALTMCDEDGALFATADDIGALDNAVVKELFEKTQKLNALEDKAVEEAKKG